MILKGMHNKGAKATKISLDLIKNQLLFENNNEASDFLIANGFTKDSEGSFDIQQRRERS